MPALGYSNRFTWIMTAAGIAGLYRIATDPPPLTEALLILGVCLVVTDLLSGLLHVILDNPRSLDIGPIKPLAEGFQRHHENPSKIFEMSLYEHLFVMHLPLSIFAVIALPFWNSHLFVAYLGMIGTLHLMQMAHRWAHIPSEELHPVVRALQRAKLLISKDIHDSHHVDPFDKNFCIMSGLFNWPLNWVVRKTSRFSHAWIGVFFVASLIPVITALFLAWR